MVLVASRVLTGFGFGSFTVSSVVALEILRAGGTAGKRAGGSGHRPSSPSPSSGTCSVGSVYGLLGSEAFFSIAALGPVLGAILAWRWLPGRRDPSIPPSVTDVQEAEVR